MLVTDRATRMEDGGMARVGQLILTAAFRVLTSTKVARCMVRLADSADGGLQQQQFFIGDKVRIRKHAERQQTDRCGRIRSLRLCL